MVKIRLEGYVKQFFVMFRRFFSKNQEVILDVVSPLFFPLNLSFPFLI